MTTSKRIHPVERRKADTEPAAKAARLAKLHELHLTKIKTGVKVTAGERPLTDKQIVFVKEWASGESVSSAYSRAGYKDSGMVYEMIKDPRIIALYQKEQALYAQAAMMTKKKVMDGFIEAADMARTLADPTALTGAWREIGKMCGYYEPTKRTIDINVSGELTMKKLEALPDHELLALIKGEVEDVAFTEISDDNQDD